MASSSTTSPPPSKTDSAGTSKKHRYKMKVPKLTAKWDPLAVLPKNTARPGDVPAKMDAKSEYPPSAPDATIVIQRADNSKVISTNSQLKLDSNKIVNKSDGNQPLHEFTLDDGIWEDWDKLEYHFVVSIDKASATTTQPVKVKRWHVQAVDMSDNRPGFPAMRTSEANNFKNAFAGAADDVGHSWSFQANSGSKSDFGGMMLNSYSCNYTGHGGVVCGVCNKMYGCKDDVDMDDPAYLRWTYCEYDYTHNQPISCHCVSAYPWVQAPDVINPANFSNTPKYLMFSICCGGAYEPSLFGAYRTRGTKYCIGFRKSTLCTWARDYAKSFYTTWAQTHNCDPDKIAVVYKSLWATWQTKLEPVFFGDDSVPSAPTDPRPGPSFGAWLRHVGHVIASIF